MSPERKRSCLFSHRRILTSEQRDFKEKLNGSATEVVFIRRSCSMRVPPRRRQQLGSRTWNPAPTVSHCFRMSELRGDALARRSA